MFSKLSPEVCRTLAGIPHIIDEVAPVPTRFRKDIGKNIRDLSELLTSRRQSLSGMYLGAPAHFSAYLRYFFPWNLFRLCKLFAEEGAWEILSRNAGSDGPLTITDFGSGPLTLPIALWISMPALRTRAVEFRCVDINRHILKTGEQLFAKIAGKTVGRGPVPWSIKPICASLTEARIGQKASLVTAVNVYNEIFWKINAADRDAFVSYADGEAARLASFCGDNGSVLIVEPGIPRSGEFIAHIRDRLIERGFSVDAPCTHHADCPMRTGKTQTRSAKWCHFTFPTGEAPEALHNLSSTARLPKERGALSFLLARKITEPQSAASKQRNVPIRVISDMFPLPDGGCGRYGCAEKGLVLLTGSRSRIESQPSGSTIFAPVTGKEPVDRKSGAIILTAERFLERDRRP
jgi:hypothetical protein